MVNIRALAKAAVATFGQASQNAKAMEELAELLVELARAARGDDRANVIEELVDAEIMLEQLKVIHGCHGPAREVYECFRERKAERLGALVDEAVRDMPDLQELDRR